MHVDLDKKGFITEDLDDTNRGGSAAVSQETRLSTLFRLFFHTHDQIQLSDTKAALVLGSTAVILPFIMSQTSLLVHSTVPLGTMILLILCGLGLVAAILFAFRAIFPIVTKRETRQLLFERLLSLPEEKYRRVMGMETDDPAGHRRTVGAEWADLTDLLTDQIRVNATIIKSKFRSVRGSIVSLGTAIAAYLAVFILNL